MLFYDIMFNFVYLTQGNNYVVQNKDKSRKKSTIYYQSYVYLFLDMYLVRSKLTFFHLKKIYKYKKKIKQKLISDTSVHIIFKYFKK